MKTRLKFFYLLLFIFISSCVKGQTIYAILVINRDDKSIGCEIDERNIKSMLKNASKKANMNLVIDSEIPLEADKIKKKIENLKVGNDDAIFFYYSGHGFRYNNSNSEYSFLAVKDIKNNKIGLEDINKLIRNKQARLTFVVGDLCNKAIPVPEPSETHIDILNDNYIRLFKNAKGYIIACSSKVDQYSLGSSKEGGVFTNSFLDCFNRIVIKKEPAKWETIFKETKDQTRLNTVNSSVQKDQTPVYKTEIDYIK